MNVLTPGITALMLLISITTGALAETITIGKGSGIVWEGMPFNKTLNGPLHATQLYTQYGLLSVSSDEQACMDSSELKTIAGILTLPLGATGVGLVPRASGTVSYVRHNGKEETMTGTIGLPETRGTTSGGVKVSSPSGLAWCLPPSMIDAFNFYSTDDMRTASITGNWVLVADGHQKMAEVVVPPMYFGSYSATRDGDRYSSILPTSITLRISSLECTVNTPTAINFNTVGRNTETGKELAKLSFPLMTSCGQPSDMIDASINLQFRALTGMYGDTPTRLSLRQGGGYITGEISDVTGSGSCNATTGLPFDGSAVKLGNITASQTSKDFMNQVTWRLCSGGSQLPTGAVDAAAEMLVTFN